MAAFKMILKELTRPRRGFGPTPVCPHLRRDWARPAHICAGTGLAPCPDLHRDSAHPLPTFAPGLGSSPSHICPHLHRDWAHPLPTSAHICTGTGLAPAHISPHLHRDRVGSDLATVGAVWFLSAVAGAMAAGRADIHIRARMCTHAHAYVRTYIPNIQTDIHTQRACVHAYKHAHVRACMRLCACARARVRACVSTTARRMLGPVCKAQGPKAAPRAAHHFDAPM